MSYIRQGQLFSWEEFVENEEDNTRLVLVVDARADEKLLQWLRDRRKGRRNEYPLAVLWRCVVAKFVYQIKTYAELIRELQRKGRLRRLVGIASRGWVPKDYHFSRFLGILSSEEGREHLRQIFEELVARLSQQIDGLGQHVAIDGTPIHAYSNGSSKPISDPDAAWGAGGKTKADGSEEVEYWIAFDLQPANDSETKRLAPIFEQLHRHHPGLAQRIVAVMADRGYDSRANCRYVYDQLEALPIIKMRLPARPALRGGRICLQWLRDPALCQWLSTGLLGTGRGLAEVALSGGRRAG